MTLINCCSPSVPVLRVIRVQQKHLTCVYLNKDDWDLFIFFPLKMLCNRFCLLEGNIGLKFTVRTFLFSVHFSLYNMVLDITRFKDVSQKCIDYIEK